jgi:hypothetical protein
MLFLLMICAGVAMPLEQGNGGSNINCIHAGDGCGAKT